MSGKQGKYSFFSPAKALDMWVQCQWSTLLNNFSFMHSNMWGFFFNAEFASTQTELANWALVQSVLVQDTHGAMRRRRTLVFSCSCFRVCAAHLSQWAHGALCHWPQFSWSASTDTENNKQAFCMCDCCKYLLKVTAVFLSEVLPTLINEGLFWNAARLGTCLQSVCFVIYKSEHSSPCALLTGKPVIWLSTSEVELWPYSLLHLASAFLS